MRDKFNQMQDKNKSNITYKGKTKKKTKKNGRMNN